MLIRAVVAVEGEERPVDAAGVVVLVELIMDLDARQDPVGLDLPRSGGALLAAAAAGLYDIRLARFNETSVIVVRPVRGQPLDCLVEIVARVALLGGITPGVSRQQVELGSDGVAR